MLEFDNIPLDPDVAPTLTAGGKPGRPTPSSTHEPLPPHEPVSSVLAMLNKGSAGRAFDTAALLLRWCAFSATAQILYAVALH